MCSWGPPHMVNQKQDDQLEHSYSSYVMIRDVTPKTCRRRWMIGRRGERGSGISMLAARHDDDVWTLLNSLKYCYLIAVEPQAPPSNTIRTVWRIRSGQSCWCLGLTRGMIGLVSFDLSSNSVRAKGECYKSRDHFGCRVTDCSTSRISSWSITGAHPQPIGNLVDEEGGGLTPPQKCT